MADIDFSCTSALISMDHDKIHFARRSVFVSTMQHCDIIYQDYISHLPLQHYTILPYQLSDIFSIFWIHFFSITICDIRGEVLFGGIPGGRVREVNVVKPHFLVGDRVGCDARDGRSDALKGVVGVPDERVSQLNCGCFYCFRILEKE